ncbi:MAG: DUF4376 domain-containing protein [Ignavibacteriae bacterium]|nr:DUF4376 domain-containing protein [Ignavibacteriota bacterium]
MYKFAKVSSNTVIDFLFEKPIWYSSFGQLVSTEELANNHNIYPVTYDIRPKVDEIKNFILEYNEVNEINKTVTVKYKVYTDEFANYDPRKYMITANNSGNMIFDEENLIVKNRLILESRTLDNVLSNAKIDIETYRDKKVFSDYDYKLSESNTIIAQLRNGSDVRNLMILGTDALYNILKNNNANSTFRDKNNTVHTLTAEQMYLLTKEIKDRNETIYSTSWFHKSELATIKSDSNKTDEQKIDAILLYLDNALI